MMDIRTQIITIFVSFIFGIIFSLKPFVLYEVDGTKTFDYEQLCKEVYL